MKIIPKSFLLKFLSQISSFSNFFCTLQHSSVLLKKRMIWSFIWIINVYLTPCKNNVSMSQRRIYAGVHSSQSCNNSFRCKMNVFWYKVFLFPRLSIHIASEKTLLRSHFYPRCGFDIFPKTTTKQSFWGNNGALIMLHWYDISVHWYGKR